MHKTLLVLSLVGLTVLATTSDAFAQRGGRGGGGRGGSSSVGRGSVGRASVGRASVGRGYTGAGYGGRGYAGGGYGGRGYGGGYYGGGYGGGGLFGGVYYGGLGDYGYGGSYAPSYYDATPVYSDYSDQATLAPTQVRQSYYPATVQDYANVTVLVPAADAQVWFDNNATTQQGTQRLFNSPPLTANQNFTYTIKARWMENGKAVDQERQVNVQAGHNVTVNFREKSREIVTSPMPKAPAPVPQK